MIVCPNCSHQNPDSAVQCEACYTPLPALTTCPNCRASVQADASFCGQCGFDLRTVTAQEVATGSPVPAAGLDPLAMPSLMLPDPLVVPDPLAFNDPNAAAPAVPDRVVPDLDSPATMPPAAPPAAVEPVPPAPLASSTATRLQVSQARLLHVQTDTPLELPPSLSIIHIGKPNERVPPHIDASGFPDSEIVSRVHATIRVEGDAYYLEDVGSSNGTYVNNMPLPVGNRHRLRAGDRIALGKGDKVSFIFQIS